MAKVLNPLMSTSARGKVGGLIFNVWRGINTVKGFKSPAQPRSSRQLAVRAILSTLSRAWASLTAAQRDDWATWASTHTVTDWTGQAVRMTGENAFVKCNSLLLDMSKAQVSSPPAVAAPTSLANLVLTGGAGQISAAFTARTGTAETVDFWVYGPHSAGQNPTIVKASHQAYAPGETTPFVLSGLSPGLYTVWARVVSETDGQVSPFVAATATVS